MYVDGAAALTETSGLEQLIEMLMGDALLGDGTALRRVDIESMLAQIEASVTSDDVMAMIFEAGEADGFGGANWILGLERVDELTRDRPGVRSVMTALATIEGFSIGQPISDCYEFGHGCVTFVFAVTSA